MTPWTVARARLLCPWNSPGQNTGVGCHFLLQRVFLTQGSNPGLECCKQILYHLSYQGSPLAPQPESNPHPQPWKAVLTTGPPGKSQWRRRLEGHQLSRKLYINRYCSSPQWPLKTASLLQPPEKHGGAEPSVQHCHLPSKCLQHPPGTHFRAAHAGDGAAVPKPQSINPEAFQVTRNGSELFSSPSLPALLLPLSSVPRRLYKQK